MDTVLPGFFRGKQRILMQDSLKYGSNIANIGLGVKIYELRIVRFCFDQVASQELLLFIGR